MKKTLIMIIFILGGSCFYAGYAQNVGEFTYQASFPAGEFSDFVSKTSWVGFAGGGRHYTNKQFSIGGSFSWHYFPDKKGKQTTKLEGDNGVLTGNFTNYTNIYGLMFIAQYDFKDRKEKLVPFVRGGVGGAYQNQRQDFGIYSYKYDGAQFMMNAEAGLTFNKENHGITLAATYHYLPAASDMVTTSFFGIKLGYAGFSY